jgi:hypothetical protein
VCAAVLATVVATLGVLMAVASPALAAGERPGRARRLPASVVSPRPGDDAARTAAGATAAAKGQPGEPARPPLESNGCQRMPAHKRVVKLNLKPETDIVDLISWISSITCRQFLLSGSIPASSKKVTVYSPQLITPDEAYKLFLSALDTVGLTVQQSGGFYRVIETTKIKSTAVDFYGADGKLLYDGSDASAP